MAKSTITDRASRICLLIILMLFGFVLGSSMCDSAESMSRRIPADVRLISRFKGGMIGLGIALAAAVVFDVLRTIYRNRKK